MPITFTTDKSKHLTVFKVTGKLDFERAMLAIEAFYAENPTKNVIWDMTETTDIQITSREVEALAQFEPRYEGKRASGKTAFVAQKDVLFGLSRMFEIRSNIKKAPYTVCVFRNMDDAYKWFEKS